MGLCHSSRFCKKKPTRENLNIEVYSKQPKQYSNNLWGKFKKALFYPSPDFTCTVSVALEEQYDTINIDVRRWYYNPIRIKNTGWEGKAWKKIEARFDQLIDKLYTKLGYSPQTQQSANPT